VTLATSIAQIASPILYAAFIVVIYFQLRSARESVQELRQEFLAGGRPVVAVHDEYDTTTRSLSVVVENVGQGPAKDVNFVFSRALESSDGLVISELPLFTIGLTSLSPAARISCYWDDFDDLMAHLRAQDLEGTDFEVTVRYSDLAGASYSNRWDIQPAIYQGLRAQPVSTDAQAGGTRDTEPSTAAGARGPVGALSGPQRAPDDVSTDSAAT
jgi:hypothetical protein